MNSVETLYLVMPQGFHRYLHLQSPGAFGRTLGERLAAFGAARLYHCQHFFGGEFGILPAGAPGKEQRSDCVPLEIIIMRIGKVRPEEKADREASAPEEKEEPFKVQRSKPGEGGFADIAGMESLKEELNKRVIWVLKDKEKAEKYRLSPPNGMLLYGPPGCGKTFFAQKFAEESGFNDLLVNGSDLGSIYVHGTQGKIAELFKKAEESAPTVICFDEFDAFVPNRGSQDASHKADEVNEFLSQLNNCAQRGIFVIGTTNRMELIDPAVLRKGRLDLHVEVPAPDKETRKKMFQIHLKDRPLEDNLDLDHLAEMTDGYASSDIAFLVNEAAMVAALADELIGEKFLEDAIRNNPSSLPKECRQKKIGF